jgi:hypothetical protein
LFATYNSQLVAFLNARLCRKIKKPLIQFQENSRIFLLVLQEKELKFFSSQTMTKYYLCKHKRNIT